LSYHETYEFFAIDRCLTPAEMRALRAVSTRATITPARFFNFYDWGGLKGDPREMLRRYFDLFVYTGNGLPHLGMLRFPAARVDRRRWQPYVAEQRGTRPPDRAASVATQGDVAILTITPAEDASLSSADRRRFGDSDDPWDEDEAEELFGDELSDAASWPVPLALVRADLLTGDLRPLYLLWLLSVQCGERRASAAEPPCPPGLERPTGTLYAFAEFLRLNADLLTVALEGPAANTRTAGRLLDAARARANGRQRAAATRAAAARAKRLATLAKRQETEWSEIDRLLGAPQVKPTIYDDLIQRLTALQELGADRGEEAAFRARLQALVGRHGSKAALRRRVREARLTRGEEGG
jgi:hypothetical protein